MFDKMHLTGIVQSKVWGCETAAAHCAVCAMCVRVCVCVCKCCSVRPSCDFIPAGASWAWVQCPASLLFLPWLVVFQNREGEKRKTADMYWPVNSGAPALFWSGNVWLAGWKSKLKTVWILQGVNTVLAERSLLLDVFILLTQSEHNQTLWKAPGVKEKTSDPVFFIQNHTVGYLDECAK